jgi:hypothetical protein
VAAIVSDRAMAMDSDRVVAMDSDVAAAIDFKLNRGTATDQAAAIDLVAVK